MNYEDFIKEYPPELQLLDAIDALNQRSATAAESLDRLVSPTNNEKNVLPRHQKDPIQLLFSPDTQSL